MKKLVLSLLLILLVGCTPKIDFQEIEDIKYINNNKDNIESVIIHKTTLGSNDCYKVNIVEAYNSINSISSIKKSNISVTDDYMTYSFIFKDGNKKVFSFEGQYIKYKNDNYTVDNFSNVKLLEKNIVECEY